MTAPSRRRPLVAHITTTDISLALLLGPQLQAFSQNGYDVIGISAPGPFVEELETKFGVRHVPLRHATRSVSITDDGRAGFELYKLFRELRPDIVHTHNPKPGVYGRLAARAANVPVVVNTVHGLYATRDDPRVKQAAVYTIERIAAAASDAELVQNPEDLETLARLRVPKDRLHLLGNGIDLQRFVPDPETRRRMREELHADKDTVVVLAVGRLVKEKGYLELFEAAGRLTGRVQVVVAGPNEPGKADAVSREEIPEFVRLVGHRHDIEALYSAADVYVLASHREGFPRSAMEAAAMGLPIVATDIRGCRQVVDHGITGLLVPVRSPSTLAEALQRLAGDEEMRREMGKRARSKAHREFDQQRVIDLTLEVYDRLLGRNR